MENIFVGRHNELNILKNMWLGKNPSIAVIFGRRRIGKSLLIEKSLQGKDTIVIEGLENRAKQEQIRNFCLQLAVSCQKSITEFSDISTWSEAFIALYKELLINPRPVVLDEFQWLANYRTDIISELKMVWDRYISKIEGVSLVLCGSIASFMVKKVIKSTALYGRIDHQIHLKAFCLNETRQLLNTRGFAEQLEGHMFSGGVPKYLQLLANMPSMRVGMFELCFLENGYFTHEYDRIFLSHFGKNPEFELIINALAQRPYGLFRSQLVEQINTAPGGGLSQHLDDLESAGFISSHTPFYKTSLKTRNNKYFLTDAYLRFYFTFIKPNLKAIEAGVNNQQFKEFWAKPVFYTWVGRAFELTCVQHAQQIADILRFSGIQFTCGPYFAPPSKDNGGVQIDLVFNRADNVLTVCEIKYGQNYSESSIVESMEKKLGVLRKQFPDKTILPVLIAAHEPPESLKHKGYFQRIILAHELAG